MSADHEKLKRVLAEAAAKPTLADRAVYVDAACEGDSELRAKVEGLLQAHDAAGDFLRQTIVLGENNVVGEAPGSVIGRYKLLEQIGEGGFGVVFMAEQIEPVNRRVALKVVKAGMDTREVLARFEAERQALALMDHPNIAHVFDAGTTKSGRPYFVMELVRGIPVTDYCDQKQVSTIGRLQLFTKVCGAVQHAHQKGIIHRDLKPNNILVTVVDGEAVPKVIDFGVAKALGRKLTEKTLFTAFHQMVGTPAYMSPEQAELSGVDVDTRSDIYSLGVLLYELLTGVTPIDADTLRKAGIDEVCRVIRETEPLKPSTRLHALGDKLSEVAERRHSEPAALARQVRGDLDWIVMRCLDKERQRRYATANALMDDIHRHLDNEPVSARPPGTVYRARKFIRRHRVGVAMAGGLTLALSVGLAAALVGFGQARRERDRAEVGEASARAEAIKSEQVTRFLQDMLEGVGPAAARGRDTTMLREILEKTEARVGKDLKDQPAVAAELQYTMARVYRALCDYDKAEALHRQALAMRKQLWGNEHAEVADSLQGLAHTLETHGRAPEAEPLYREALAIRGKVFGPEHPDVAASLNGLASSLESQGKFDEAVATFRKALVLRRKLYGQEHPDVATSLDGLAYTLGKAGQLAEAEKLEREALAMRRKIFVTDHPELSSSVSALAQILSWRGNYSEAEILFREVIEMRERLLGKGHENLSGQYRALGNVLLAQGKLAEAETTLREMLEGTERKWSDPEVKWTGKGIMAEVATCREWLAELLLRQGKLAELLSLYREAAERGDPSAQFIAGWACDRGIGVEKDPLQAAAWYRKAAERGFVMAQYLFGAKCARGEGVVKDEREAVVWWHKVAECGDARALNDLAWILATHLDPNFRDGSNALVFAEKAVAAAGQKNPYLLNTLAAAYAEVGRYSDAVSAQKEALKLMPKAREKQAFTVRLKSYESGSPFRDPDLSFGEIRALMAVKKHAEAEPLARTCLTIRERQFPDDWQTFSARSLLGAILLGQKKYAEAEPLLLSSYEGLRQRESEFPGAARLVLKEALDRLVQLYEATGRSSQAAHFRQELEVLEKAVTQTESAQYR